MKIVEARIGAKGVDHFGPISPACARAMRDAGAEVVFVYEPEFTTECIKNVHALGMAVGFLLEGLDEHTTPNAALGVAMSAHGRSKLRDLEVPTGITRIIDLEGTGRRVEDWKVWVDACSQDIEAGADIGGLYVGAGTGLTGTELFAFPNVHRYVKGGSKILDADGHYTEPSCGWAAVQIYPLDVPLPLGLPGGSASIVCKVDFSILGTDYAGRAITVLAA